jgi:Fe2+ or Zn2+ uptake regulation protein
MLDALDTLPHSDADTLYRAIRSRVPSTSIQSVHNVLGALSAAGLVRKIEPAGSPARYERRIADNHHHLVCTSCGAIADVDCVVGEAPCLTPSATSGFQLHSAEVTFWGICADCQDS